LKEHTRKKNLGQYFTGEALARLLSYLSYKESYKTIIDPMCGNGDMLVEYSKLNEKISAYGIEIDPIVYPHIIQRTSHLSNQFQLLQGNAFNLTILNSLKYFKFDLVITNPPYIRYQRLSKNRLPNLPLLDAKTIRNNLLQFSYTFPFEDETDRIYFKRMIANYSGLSDLAVPSWLLCAMFTKIGGTLAMVVPETWLNRDYALIIQYLLLRWFRIKYIIEDANATWFKDAQVKTTLLVAERIKRKPSAFSWNNEIYHHIAISNKAKNNKSIIGNLYPNDKLPEKDFINDLKSIRFINTDKICTNKIGLAQKANSLKVRIVRSKWLPQLENSSQYLSKSCNETKLIIPDILQKWLEPSSIDFNFLENYGVKIGQGLRTGANRFFYVDIKKEVEDGWIVRPNKIFSNKDIFVPSNCLKKVLRKQVELNDSFQLNTTNLNGGVLTFKHQILEEDYNKLEQTNSFFQNELEIIPKEVSSFIKKVATQNIGSLKEPKYIPELSAVAPNVRRWNSQKPSIQPRFWYMLPSFKSRHIPDLFIARINNKHPKAILNANPKILIDANFSTIWLVNGLSKIDKYAVLAIMNSTWVYCLMEMTATVMGGGALKLEATHLRSTPIPIFSPNELTIFSQLGKTLVDNQASASILEEIDDYMMEIFFGKKHKIQKLGELNRIKNQKLSQRLK